jgi:hypothetical protein
MATITPTKNPANPHHDLAIWTPVTEADTAAGTQLLGNGDRTVQVLGTFGSATVVWHGSLDGTNYAPLQDAEGDAISFTSAGIKTILEAAPYIKPVISGGTSQSLTLLAAAGRL